MARHWKTYSILLIDEGEIQEVHCNWSSPSSKRKRTNKSPHLGKKKKVAIGKSLRDHQLGTYFRGDDRSDVLVVGASTLCQLCDLGQSA